MIVAKTFPRVKQINAAGGRRYDCRQMGGDLYPSVTTVLGVISKPALLHWAANQATEAAIRAAVEAHIHERLPAYEGEFEADIRSRLKGQKAHEKARDNSAAIGSNAHARIEHLLRCQAGLSSSEPDRMPESDQSVNSFVDWAKSVRLEPVVIEQTVWSVASRYAGTMDMLGYADIDGQRRVVCADWKTGAKVYPESTLQISAYSRAVVELGWATPPVDGVVVCLPRDGSPVQVQRVPWEDQERLLEAFLAALRLWQWQQEAA